MPVLIGVDEAGYGPNLGPLVVMATVWRTPDGVDHEQLYDAAASVFTRDPPANDDARLWVTDSKRVHRPKAGLSPLECSVAPILPTPPTGWPCRFTELWGLLDPQYRRDAARVPWYMDGSGNVPCQLAADAIASKRDWVRNRLAESNIALVEVVGHIIVERRFNALLRREGKKSSLLTSVTLRLVRDLIRKYSKERVDVLCDRHGGRQHYAAALQEWLGSEPVRACREERLSSRYQIGIRDDSPRIQFLVRSESLLATALASMTAKYVRELAMREFNTYWCDRLPNVVPTAGYPVDARRFRRQIAPAQRSLGIPDAMLWRGR